MTHDPALHYISVRAKAKLTLKQYIYLKHVYKKFTVAGLKFCNQNILIAYV